MIKMKTNNIFKLVVSALFFIGSAVNAVELTAPQQVIEDTSNELKQVLKNDRDLLQSDPAFVYHMVDEVLIPNFDLHRISKLVIGRKWKKVSPEQQVSFQQEFKKMLVRTYATAFNELDDWHVTYLPSRPGRNEHDVVVRTQISRNGPPVAVDYRMIFKESAWKVYDVKIEGMSLVTNYRSSFNRLMRTSGMDGLIAHLSETNQQKETGLKEGGQNKEAEFQKVAHTTN